MHRLQICGFWWVDNNMPDALAVRCSGVICRARCTRFSLKQSSFIHLDALLALDGCKSSIWSSYVGAFEDDEEKVVVDGLAGLASDIETSGRVKIVAIRALEKNLSAKMELSMFTWCFQSTTET